MCVPRALWRSAWLCKAPCRQHHRCPALWQRGRACCSATKDAGDQSEFQAWLRANPLPGSKAPPLAASADAVQPQPLLQAQRFHWSQAPAVAENCMLRHSQLAWALEAPGVLVACSVAGQPLVRLRLPRVLAGAQPLLFGTRAGASLQLHLNGGWPSPLHTKPEEESRSLLQALRHLAQQQPAAAAIDSWDCGGSSGQAALHSPSIGSQLLVLLSADSAALAIYQEGELVRHRVHTGYTVRRQQGKAQATYQRQGGGGCCGLGIRRGKAWMLSALARCARCHAQPACSQALLVSNRCALPVLNCRRAQRGRQHPGTRNAPALPSRCCHAVELGPRDCWLQPSAAHWHR